MRFYMSIGFPGVGLETLVVKYIYYRLIVKQYSVFVHSVDGLTKRKLAPFATVIQMGLVPAQHFHFSTLAHILGHHNTGTQISQ